MALLGSLLMKRTFTLHLEKPRPLHYPRVKRALTCSARLKRRRMQSMTRVGTLTTSNKKLRNSGTDYLEQYSAIKPEEFWQNIGWSTSTGLSTKTCSHSPLSCRWSSVSSLTKKRLINATKSGSYSCSLLETLTRRELNSTKHLTRPWLLGLPSGYLLQKTLTELSILPSSYLPKEESKLILRPK